jgi:hypothetical protein
LTDTDREATTAMLGNAARFGPSDRPPHSGAAMWQKALVALLLLVAGCGRRATSLHEAILLPDGRIEWQAEGSRLIQVPRGLAVTRTVRLTNRTGRSLRNVAARTSCPSCSSARVDAELA